ncbi:MAG: hypothetical protein MUE81_05920 [Thermoflexibacter sp.]|nr:hypothetical protein [Thermoflexibacter sp.]
MRYLRIFLFLIIFVEPVYSQTSAVVAILASRKSNQKTILRQVQEGTVTLTNGQVVTGRFKYDNWEFPVKNFAFYKDANLDSRKKIKFKDIKQVSFVGVDTNIAEKPDSTTFINVNGKLLRKLTEGKINLYDKLIVVKEAEGVIGATIFVKEGEKLKRIDTLRKFNKWYQSLSKQYPDLQVQNKYLNKIEILKEIQKYNAR